MTPSSDRNSMTTSSLMIRIPSVRGSYPYTSGPRPDRHLACGIHSIPDGEVRYRVRPAAEGQRVAVGRQGGHDAAHTLGRLGAGQVEVLGELHDTFGADQARVQRDRGDTVVREGGCDRLGQPVV